MREKILVTGGAGYIGSILVPDLLSIGYKVIVLDNLVFDQTSLLNCCADPNFEFIQGDICDYDKVKALISESDIIIPLLGHLRLPFIFLKLPDISFFC